MSWIQKLDMDYKTNKWSCKNLLTLSCITDVLQLFLYNRIVTFKRIEVYTFFTFDIMIKKWQTVLTRPAIAKLTVGTKIITNITVVSKWIIECRIRQYSRRRYKKFSRRNKMRRINIRTRRKQKNMKATVKVEAIVPSPNPALIFERNTRDAEMARSASTLVAGIAISALKCKSSNLPRCPTARGIPNHGR